MTVSADRDANRDIVSRALTAWHEATAPITDLFAPDMVWRIEGRSVVSGEYPDRQAFIDEVLAPFGARFGDGDRSRSSARR